MEYKNIIVEREEGFAVITLNRPRSLNALNWDLMFELNTALTELEEDDEVKSVIITGAGEKAFSAGADIHEMVDIGEEETERRQLARSKFQWHLANYKKPTIGAINGLAFGGAALMSSSFDMRVGCERTRFKYLAASYGRLNSTWTLPIQVGYPKAKELLFTGREVGAQEAKEIGLLNQLVSSDQLLEAAKGIAKLIAKNNPLMVQGIKQLVNDGIGESFRRRLDMEMEGRSGSLKGTPVKEGFKPFLDRKGRDK